MRRGVFRATRKGEELLAAHPDRIDNRILGQYPEFRAFQSKRRSAGTDQHAASEIEVNEKSTPAEQIDSAIQEIEAEVRTDLISRILAIHNQAARAAFFEEVVVQLLTAMGYGDGVEGAGARLGQSGDGGIDGVIKLDALGIDRVYVQAKCYDPTALITPGQVRDFSGALDDKKTTRGVFITTARFSDRCRDYVHGIQKQIVLVDGDELARLMLRYNVGVRTDRTVIIKRLDEDFFDL